ncbi:YraN family protein [Candidatus Woesebacteria bacterium]|nr:YraN family protein [Candidatus Woesebacteria bacterium]MCD8507515.1 YraN family protein [Candidatus Woesebacteria bacterium]MCD8527328.1 YraN family protein [Candidatus Woesebacteria bacterium]MCD8545746.1 YraN family protein [Candidatus Woesebacteria bacterium]
MSEKNSTVIRGKTAEAIAAQYLKNKHFQVLRQNVYTPYGEIDIIAKQGREYVCVEVRSRSSQRQLPPETTLSARKYQRIIRSILHIPWLENKSVRIDFITVLNDAVQHHYRDLRWDSLRPGRKLQYSF